MAESGKKNAIEERLDYLEGLWNEFAEDPDARLLRWLTDDDGTKMVDLLVDVQNEEAGEIPDLFVCFNEPFENHEKYGFALRESLINQYSEIREEITKEDIASDWECPAPVAGEPDFITFARSCISFREYYEGIMLHLVIYLIPPRISDDVNWQKWLLALTRAGLPANVRIMVIDNANEPMLNRLCETEKQLVVTKEPELDMPGAYQELADDTPVRGPGVTFRRLFVAMTNAVAQGDLRGATRAGKAALKIATDQNWRPMQVVVFQALGVAYLSAGKTADALAFHREGVKAARTAEEEQDPAGPKLVIQTRLAEAAVLFGERDYKVAGTIYEEVAPLAEKQDDLVIAMDSWRMAAYCREKAREHDRAWEYGCQALSVGEKLDEETRAHSTLPYAGQGLLRLTETQAYRPMEKKVRQRMVDLLGPDWEKELKTK